MDLLPLRTGDHGSVVKKVVKGQENITIKSVITKEKNYVFKINVRNEQA